jgi:voltage-gated potassium channel
MPKTPEGETRELHEERWELLRQIDELADAPLTALSFVWLILLVIDLTSGLNPLLNTLSYIIWGLFILDFLVGIVIAPDKSTYVRRNWLTAVALLLPALRVLRIFRAFRVLRAARGVRSLTMVRLVTTLNRGMRAVRRTLGRRGVGYVAALTLIIAFAGAAGIYFFEGPPGLALDPDGAPVDGLNSYADALWFTMMLMTTLGSEYWPATAEGRILTFFISLYALGVFGYLAGNIASYFVETGDREPRETAGLQEELSALRQQLALVTTQLEAREAD